MATAKNPKLYHAIKHMNKGGLHRALKVPEGEKIPTAKLQAAAKSENSHVRRMAAFAKVLKGFKH